MGSKRIRVCLLALLALPGLACLAPRGTGGADVSVADAALTGSLGAYSHGDAVRVADVHGDYVELRSSGEHGAIMAGLSVDDGVAGLEPGEVYEYEDGYGADVIGCGGPSEGTWSYDRRADRVRITVEDRGDLRRLTFVADWDDGSEVEGSFDYY